jgi:hypothetical protein
MIATSITLKIKTDIQGSNEDKNNQIRPTISAKQVMAMTMN